jgi:outer membrane receptor protein involved in Fe transport
MNRAFTIVVMLFSSIAAFATIFGSVHGLIHDPQHRPVQGAQVTLHSTSSDWKQAVTSDEAGEFHFAGVPLGEYKITVDTPGFAAEEQLVSLASGRDARIHFGLTVAKTKETLQVTDTAGALNSESSTTTNVVSRQQIAETPGADQTNSLAMITDYTPGAYMVHDQLHIRGGHQVSWLLDGVPVPNTNIASNVGPQFDPKDIDYLEVQRGGYSAEYGDRTYGVFNVVTRSGFERNRQAELVTNYGSFNSTNDQFSFGDHTDRFAYYGSLSGYRTDLGLETSSPEVLHDQAAGLGGFASLIFNKTPADQLRLVTSLRGDHYQVPNDPDQQAAGIRDVEDERDSFVNFTWMHTVSPGILTTVSPFYHFNRAHYRSGPDDPVHSEYDNGSNYDGGVATVTVTRGRHNIHAGLQAFGERDNQFYSVVDTTPGSPDNFDPQRTTPWANVETVFVEDQFKATSWLTFNGGLRLSHYGGPVNENAADPRVGAAVRIPRLGWVLRGFYGRFYQLPPLVSVTNPTLNADQTFVPLRGERDEQHEFGLTIPIARWTIDIANFRTAASNFFDHDVLGNSNIFFPLTLERARIRGWEATANSPTIGRAAQFHLAYSHQYAQWAGGITGGLTSLDSCDATYCFLDHDQRDTLSTGVNFYLPWQSTANFNTSYGSGFLNGEGDEQPTHLPSHTTFDLSGGKSFGEKWSIRLTALNLSNHRYLLDNSNTFGGTHFVNPREISFQLKYRFHY